MAKGSQEAKQLWDQQTQLEDKVLWNIRHLQIIPAYCKALLGICKWHNSICEWMCQNKTLFGKKKQKTLLVTL